MHRFSRTPVTEVHLVLAPLAKVLMQVQFSRTPQLVTDEAEAVIAERLARYPVRRRLAVATGFTFAVNGQQVALPPPLPSSVLTFSDASGKWVVSVADTSVSIETTDYATRDDYCARALELFDAVAAVSLPPVVDRVGLRYIDRLSGATLDRLDELVIPELRGLHGAVEQPLVLNHSVTDSVITIGDNEHLQVKSGFLPPGGAFDPSLPPLPEPSWILDMDVFTTVGGFAFDPEALTERLRDYAETAYSFFRFATTEAFQELHQQPSAAAMASERP